MCLLKCRFKRFVKMKVPFLKKETICFLIFLIVYVQPHHNDQATRIRREILEDNLQSYLMKFGYLSSSPASAGALRTEESVRDAIRDLQEFAGLPLTGQLDEMTRRLMSKPRCGLPDRQSPLKRLKRFSIQGQKWQYTNLTWSLRTKNLRHLNLYEVRYVLSKALDVWAKHSRLTFTEVDSDRADILIYFHRGNHGDNFAFDGKGQILAHAFFPGTGRGGDAHFDEDEVWLTREDDNNDEGTSLFQVAAHEFGHSLGLSHSSVEGALMYPWYQGMQNGFDYELPEDDRLGIQALYGIHQGRVYENNPVWQQTPSTTTTTTSRPVTTTSVTPKSYPRRPDYPYNTPNYPEKPRYPENKPRYPSKPNYPRKPMHPDRKHYSPKVHHKPGYFPDKGHHHPEESPRRKWTQTTTRYYFNNDRSSEDDNTGDKAPYDGKNKFPFKENSPPNTCDTSYDAVSVIRREVFIFKDRWFWRIGDSGLMPGYPAEITRLWRGLPKNLSHVDAVYERPDNKIVFFIGKMYYLYSGNNMERGFPKPLTELGLPESISKIDGAMVWGHNGKTYFYSGNMYWRFDEDLMKVELDYPRDMSMWRGVGTDIDAVFQWKDGKTYFFKGKGFWKFNDLYMRVENEEQTPSAPFWMGCLRNLESPMAGSKAPYTYLPSGSSCMNFNTHIVFALIGIILKIYMICQ